MARFRINWFDMVGRAMEEAARNAHMRGRRVLGEVEIARAIETLSASYRAGGDPDHSSAAAQAAYLWHHLPAHVHDLSRLFSDLPELFLERESLSFLDLGAGPGTGILAFLDALSAAQERGQAKELKTLEVRHVESERAWNASLRVLLPVALQAARGRAPGLLPGEELKVPKAQRADLTQPPEKRFLKTWDAADLVLAANLLSEVSPRGTDELPPGLAETFRTLFARVKGSKDLLVVDRAGAPGAAARVEALVALAEESGAIVRGPRERSTRCADLLTKQAKRIYRHVNFPTTKNADEPVRNCRSLWALLSWGAEAEAPPAED